MLREQFRRDASDRPRCAVCACNNKLRGTNVKSTILLCSINPASLGGFGLGVTLGWNSSAGEVLRDVLNASGTEIGLVGGILNAGACVGVILAPFLTKYLSRAATLLLTTLGFIVGWSFICFADQKVCFHVPRR